MDNLTSLTLDLSNNLIGSEGAGVIADSLSNLTSLNYLDLNLESNYIDNVGFEMLVDISN